MPNINKSIEYIELKVKHIRHMIYIYSYLYIYIYIVMVYDMFIFYIPNIIPPKQRTTIAREAKLVRGSLETFCHFWNSTTLGWEKARHLMTTLERELEIDRAKPHLQRWGLRDWAWPWVRARLLAGWAWAARPLSLTKRARRLANHVLHDVYLIYMFISTHDANHC